MRGSSACPGAHSDVRPHVGVAACEPGDRDTTRSVKDQLHAFRLDLDDEGGGGWIPGAKRESRRMPVTLQLLCATARRILTKVDTRGSTTVTTTYAELGPGEPDSLFVSDGIGDGTLVRRRWQGEDPSPSGCACGSVVGLEPPALAILVWLVFRRRRGATCGSRNR